VPSATAAQTFKALNDVNVTSLTDGALIQYDAATDKFVTRNELETTTGTITFNGGAF
jgi:phage baseplate assembly protein gpV